MILMIVVIAGQSWGHQNKILDHLHKESRIQKYVTSSVKLK